MLIYLGTYKGCPVQYDTQTEEVVYIEKIDFNYKKYTGTHVPMPQSGFIGDDDDPIVAWCEQNLEGFEVTSSFAVTYTGSSICSVW